MESRSPTLSVRARGPLACFTRPELKVERVSYPVMTPSAARGLLEAILWKPAIAWRIQRIHVLNEIKFTAFRRNEVNSKISTRGKILPYYAEKDRAQRNTVALSDVDYVVEAYFEMTPKAGPEDNVNKFVEMFNRRVSKGQHHHQPCFGCREFVADVFTAQGAPPAANQTRELGLMLWDILYGKKNRPVFFDARLDAGILHVPRFEDLPQARKGVAV